MRQYEALLETESVKLEFRPDAIRRLAEIAWQVNEKTENIGARRLYTVMERLLEDVSFNAAKHAGETIVIDAAYVDERLKGLAQSEDLARYVSGGGFGARGNERFPTLVFSPCLLFFAAPPRGGIKT